MLTGIVLVLLWGTVLIRLPTLWRDARQRAMWATLCSLALAKTFATPGVNTLVDLVVPYARVVPHLLGVATAFFLLRFISLITDHGATRPHAARYQRVLAGAVLATLIVLAAVTRGGIAAGGTDLTRDSAPPATAAYWVVLNGYLGAVLVVAAALFWRISRSAGAGLLRHGLRAMATGTALVALYAVLKTSLIVVHSFGVPMSFASIEPAANALRSFGTIVAIVGAAVPAGGRLRAVFRAYRSLRALRPLWLVMRRTFPDIILFPRRRALLELAGVDDVRLRLYRRVIEIRDGMLALRGHLPAGALTEARRYVGADAALVEACGIALALERHRARHPPTENGDHWAEIGGELADEVAWLTEVSAAFSREETVTFAHRYAEPTPVGRIPP